MIPILYATADEALGGVWTEKKGTFQKNYYWNCETATAVLTAYTGNYTAYDPIAVTPGKLYHIHAVRGASSKSRVLLFVKSDYTILWKLEANSSPVDRDVIAPANAAYALITAGTKNDTYLGNVECKEYSTGGTITNGLGALTDCITAEVTEEARNGVYELEFTYPVTGIHYSDIQVGRAVNVTHSELGDLQPFIIYQVTAPMSGIITVCAWHISYLLSNVIIPPITATSVSDAFDQFQHKTMTPNRFEYWTDNTTSGTFTVKTPDSARALLGGRQGSILDVFGGEYEFDRLTVKNHASRGRDRGVTIRYGKNLTNLTDTTNNAGTYNAVVPYWTDGQNAVVYGGVVTAAGVTVPVAVPLDLSNKFEDAPTVAALETAAASYLTTNTPWVPSENLKVDFIALWQTEEYKDIAPLERVWLYDTVHVIYPDLNVNATAQVIKVVWDVLAERYSSMELGRARASLGETIAAGVGNNLSATLRDYARTSFLSEAIDHATQLITGGLGGYIVFTYNANGEPTEMLIMNTPDVETATKVMRFNNEGIGYSTTGYQGPFTSAWTLSDGAFVADFITAGHMLCDRLQGGTLSLGGQDNGNGVLRVYDASGNEIGSWTRTGITLNRGKLTSADGNTYFDLTNSELRCSSIYSPEPTGVEQATAAVLKGTSTGSGRTSNFVMYSELGGVNRGIKFIPPILSSDLAKINSPNGLYLYQGSKYIGIGAAPAGDQQANAVEIGITTGGKISVTSDGAVFEGKPISGFGSYYMAADDGGVRMSSNIINDDSGTYLLGFRSGSDYLCRVSKSAVSSKRYKHDIQSIEDKRLDPHGLYDVPVIQFVFNDNIIVRKEVKDVPVIGIIAEELDEHYPVAVVHDDYGRAEAWDYYYMIPGMLALIQEQKQQLDEHEKRIKAFEHKISELMEAIGNGRIY